MISWHLELTRIALKDLESIPERDQEFMAHALDRLIDNPTQVDLKKLVGYADEWRMRVGKWRVRFTFDSKTHTIRILRILLRGNAY